MENARLNRQKPYENPTPNLIGQILPKIILFNHETKKLIRDGDILRQIENWKAIQELQK